MTPAPRTTPVFVTLDQALAHLGFPAASTLLPEDVADLQLKLDTAHEWMLTYVAVRLGEETQTWKDAVAAWTVDTVPRVVCLAIEVQFAELRQFRGDQDRPDRPPRGPSPTAVDLLAHLRDPVFG